MLAVLPVLPYSAPRPAWPDWAASHIHSAQQEHQDTARSRRRKLLAHSRRGSPVPMGRRAVAALALTIGGCAAAAAVAAAAKATAQCADAPSRAANGVARRSGSPAPPAVDSRVTRNKRVAVLFRDDDVARGEAGPGLRVRWSAKSSTLARRGQQGDGDIAGVARFFALQLYGEAEAGDDKSLPGGITTSTNTALFTLEGVPVFRLAMLRSGVKLIVSRSGTPPTIPRGPTGAAICSTADSTGHSAQRVDWTNEAVTVWPSSAGAAAGDVPTELRIPQGQYLVRLLRIIHPALTRVNSPSSDGSTKSKRDLSAFLSLLTAKRSGHGKELSESFAAVDGLKRLRTLPPCPITAQKTAVNVWCVRLSARLSTCSHCLCSTCLPVVLLRWFLAYSTTNHTMCLYCRARACDVCAFVYGRRKLPSTAIIVPGDGKTPFTAAAAAVSGPSSWLLHSIDPRMAYDSCGGQSGSTKAVVGPDGQLECWRCLSEEWEVPVAVRDASCRVILAVHCHAPLGELWERLPTPKYCISLPCCGDCGLLKHAPPIVSYRDPVRMTQSAFARAVIGCSALEHC